MKPKKCPLTMTGRTWTDPQRNKKMEHMSMNKSSLGHRRRRRRQEPMEVNQVNISLCITSSAAMQVIIDAGGLGLGTTWSVGKGYAQDATKKNGDINNKRQRASSHLSSICNCGRRLANYDTGKDRQTWSDRERERMRISESRLLFQEIKCTSTPS